MKNKINLLYIIESSGTGAGRHLLDLLLNIDTAKFSVTLVYSDLRNDSLIPKYCNDLQRCGIDLINVKMTREISPLNELKALVKVRNILQGRNVDILHVHSSKAGYIGRVAAYLSNFKGLIFYTPHTMAYHKGSIFTHVEKFLAKITTKIIAVSDSEKKDIIYHKITNKDKIEVIYNGVRDLTSERIQYDGNEFLSQFGLNTSFKTIASVGRISKEKRPELFVETARYLLNKNDSLNFLWVGEGDLHNIVSELIENYGIQDNVKFVGHRDDVPDILPHIDIYISCSEYESFGYGPCEAMLFKKPVIVTNITGSKDIIQNGFNGLVSKSIPSDIGNNILKLLGDSELFNKLSVNGFKHIKENFSLKRMVEKTESLYLENWRE